MKNLIRLICLSLILLTTYVTAEITIDGETIHVETNNYKVRFAPNAITYLHNKLTDETYTLPLEQTYEIQAAILGRNENFYASRGTVRPLKINDHTAEVLFQKDGNEITLTIAIEPNTEDLLISLEGNADFSGVSAIQWAIDNLNLANLRLIVPSQKEQVIDATFVKDFRNYPYPSSYWEAQLAIVEAEGGGFYVRSTDTNFKFKNMFYKSHADKFSLRFSTQNQAPWGTLTTAESVTWRLNTYVGDWCVPAQIHRDWMEEAFDPWRLSDVPAWVSDIGLVVFHASLNAELLPNLAKVVDPTKTLIYVENWRKDRHPINYPDYTPHERFDAFLEVARQHGFRILLYVNLFDMSTRHPLYPEFQRYQYRIPETGELSGWRWDNIDSPERNAHISLASSKWRNLLIQQWKELWEKYNIDAFQLDVSHYILNDANGLIEELTSAEANVLMHKELAQAMPGVVLSGEGLHEVTFFRESFALRGFGVGSPHPISAFLFSPYTRFFGGPPGAIDPRYHLYLDTVESEGYLPTLHINKTEMLEIPLLQQVLSVARQWQELRLRPDVGCDWGPNTLFQYTTQTGETVTHRRTNSGSVLVLPNDGGYERVFGATQARTHRSLRHWRAYNDTTLLGLDPSRYYFLDNTPRNFSQLHINSLSPDIYISESRVTDEAALFHLESTGSDRRTTVGFSLPTAPVGSFPDTLRPTSSGQYTLEVDPSQPVVIFLAPFQQISLPYDLIEAEAQFTAGLQFDGIFRLGGFAASGIEGSGKHGRPTINNIKKEAINVQPPAEGQTILQFPLLLSEAPSTFSFSAGLREGCSQGVLFQVRLNGQTYFETFKKTFNWTDGSISLSEFAGQPVLLELVTDPAEESGAICDWAFWADLHITAVPNPDANLDGRINVLDLITVAQSLGQQPPGNPQADTNKDGVVNLVDFGLCCRASQPKRCCTFPIGSHRIYPVHHHRGYRCTTCFDRVRGYPQQITGDSNRHRTAPTLPSRCGSERPRDQTSA